jgi:hypothetical protein
MTTLNNLPENFFSDSVSEFKGLPDDVIKSLSNKKESILEKNIISLINAAGGELNLDKIIAGVYYLETEAYSRTTMTQKIYRMMKKELIFRVKGKKGLYTTIIGTEK